MRLQGITESTKNKNGLLTKHILHHSRTKCWIKMINFVWSITNFWNICNFMDTLTSSNIKEESYKIDMCIDREDNKLYFFIRNTVPNPKEQISIHRYNIYIQSTEGAVLCTEWKRFYFNTDPLYEICLQTLRLDETKYLPNNTLSVHFMFESYKNIIHVNIYENVIDTHQLTAATNDFVSDESDSIVTFLVEGNRLDINKSLACAASSVFNEMLNKCNGDVEGKVEKEIEINDITFNIFQIIIHYIKNNGVLEIDFDILDDTIKTKFLFALLAGAQRFDVNGLKVKCETHLIEFITKENAITFLDIAISNNASYLANYVKRFIKLHIDDFRCTTKFLEKIQISPEILYDINKQELSEENAFYIKYNGD